MIGLRRLVIFIAAWTLHAAATSSVWAGSDLHIQLPLPNQRTRQNNSRLQLRLESRWVEGSGYRPIFVELSTMPPAIADRTVTIELVANDERYAPTADGVRFEMTIGEGQTTARKEVSLLQRNPWRTLRIDVTEGGRELQDLSVSGIGLSRQITTWEWTESYPTILFVDSDGDPTIPRSKSRTQLSATSDLPDVVALSHLVPPYDDFSMDLVEELRERSQLPNDDQRRSTVERLPTFEIIAPALLPTQWKNYSSVDIVVISRDDLTLLTQQYPEAWSALRQHVATGATLWISGVAADFSDLAAIDRAFGSGESIRWRQPDPEKAGDEISARLHRDAVVRSYRRSNRGTVVEYEEPLDDDDDETDLDEPPPPAELLANPLFRIGAYRLGRIAAIGSDDLAVLAEPVMESRERGDPSVADRLSWMLAELSLSNLRWCRRTGASLRRPNRDFWEFLVPGVGAAPVNAFLGLITGFMILIGPVNYFVLRRYRKLYLLLLTVPFGALLFTAAFYGYAFVKDGLGTRVRARSFTEVDSTGQAVSWSRQSYYSGLAPAEGLVYPKSAAVFPVTYDPGERRGRRVLRMGTSTDGYGPGYLDSRETCQTLVIHQSQVEALVDVQRRDQGLVASNQLSQPLLGMLVVDEGQPYWAAGVAAGAAAELESVTIEVARERIFTLLSDHRPEKPAGFTAPRVSRRYYHYFGNCDSGFPAPSFRSGLMERQIDEVTAELLGRSPPPGGHFVVFLPQAPPFVPLGVPQARQTAGLHIVRGHW